MTFNFFYFYFFYSRIIIRYERAYKQASLLLDLASVDGDELNDDDILEFKKNMDQDFNTANVLTLLSDIVKRLNVAIRLNDLDNVLVLINTLKVITDVLGLEFNYQKLSDENKKLYLKWNEFKKNKNFEEADKIRLTLQERGII